MNAATGAPFGIDTLAMRADQRSPLGGRRHLRVRRHARWQPPGPQDVDRATEWSFATGAAIDASPRSRAASSTWRRRTGICGLSTRPPARRCGLPSVPRVTGPRRLSARRLFRVRQRIRGGLKASTGSMLWPGVRRQRGVSDLAGRGEGVVYIGFDTTAAAGGILAALEREFRRRQIGFRSSDQASPTRPSPMESCTARAPPATWCGRSIRVPPRCFWHTTAVAAPNAPIISNGTVFPRGEERHLRLQPMSARRDIVSCRRGRDQRVQVGRLRARV